MKILLIHASAGAGHTKAAEAVYEGLLQRNDCQVKIVDALDYTSPFYKNSYRKVYAWMVSNVGWLWGFFFSLTDIPWLQGLVRSCRRFLNGINAQALVRLLKEEQFDYVLSTHFFSIEVAAYLKRKKIIYSQVICIVTDFDVHRIWLAEGVDHYVAACGFTKSKLKHLGITDHQIWVTGIPTFQKFSKVVNRGELCDKIGIKKDMFSVLLATGSFGMGPMENVVSALQGFQLLVVCGNNKALYEVLKGKKQDGLHVFGLVNNMDELMSVADVMVTKPGGLSICEALVKGLPLVFFSAIPGQETNNVNVLRRHGIGLSQPNIDAMIEEIKRLSQHPEEVSSLKAKTKELAKPNAVQDLIKMLRD